MVVRHDSLGQGIAVLQGLDRPFEQRGSGTNWCSLMRVAKYLHQPVHKNKSGKYDIA